MPKRFSFQLYSARNHPPLATVLKTLADMGYAEVDQMHLALENLALLSEVEVAPLLPGSLVAGAQDLDDRDLTSFGALTDVNLDEGLTALIVGNVNQDRPCQGASRDSHTRRRLSFLRGFLCPARFERLHITASEAF